MARISFTAREIRDSVKGLRPVSNIPYHIAGDFIIIEQNDGTGQIIMIDGGDSFITVDTFDALKADVSNGFNVTATNITGGNSGNYSFVSPTTVVIASKKNIYLLDSAVNSGGCRVEFEDRKVIMEVTETPFVVWGLVNEEEIKNIGGGDNTRFVSSALNATTIFEGILGIFNRGTGSPPTLDSDFSDKRLLINTHLQLGGIGAGTTTREITVEGNLDNVSPYVRPKGAAPVRTGGDGILIDAVLADPSVLIDGQLWYNDTDDKLRVRLNGTTYNLDITAA